MSRRHTMATLALAAVVASACGSKNGSAPAGLPALDFCKQARALFGANQARCQGGAAADWTAWELSSGNTTCESIDAFVTKGTIAYHADQAAACLTEIAGYGCYGTGSGCFAAVLAGKVAQHAPCTDGWECDANSLCLDPDSLNLTPCLPHVCKHLPTVAGDLCPSDLPFCFYDLSCVAGVCVADLAPDAPCGADGQPGCPGGFLCSATSMKCVSRAAGGPCVTNFDCLGTEYCSGPVGGVMAGTCRPRLALGAPCIPAENGCGAFESCDPGGTCVAAGHLGQPCALMGDNPTVCAEGLCDGTNCVAPAANGRACPVGNECLSTNCVSGTCAACP